MNIEEGYIKFNLQWQEESFKFSDSSYEFLNSCRNELFKLGLIGAYPNGIGFGNISSRYQNDQFIISGSATGNFTKLNKKDYSLVTDFNILKNSITCKGFTKASSESLSHAVIYKSNSKIRAVIHVHHKKMWDYYLDKLPTSSKTAEYGTPEMAFEIQNLVNDVSGIIIMGGHPEGIITYGASLHEAKNILLNYYHKFIQ